MRLAQPQLGGVLDRHHPLAGADEARQRVERRRLAGAGAAADEDARAGAHRAGEEVQQRAGQRVVGDQLVAGEAAPAEAADRQHRAVERQRRDHDVHARAVGQAGVAQRLGLVDPAAQRRQDPLDRVAQVALVREPHRRPLQPAARARPTPARCRTPSPRRPRGRRAAAPAARGRTPARRCGRRARRARRRRAPPPRGPRARGCGPVRSLGALPVAGASEQAVAEVLGELVEIVHQSRQPVVDRRGTGEPVVARRPREQADLARERARGREVDRLPHGDAQRRRHLRARRRRARERGRRAPRRPRARARSCPRTPAPRSRVTRTSTRAPGADERGRAGGDDLDGALAAPHGRARAGLVGREQGLPHGRARRDGHREPPAEHELRRRPRRPRARSARARGAPPGRRPARGGRPRSGRARDEHVDRRPDLRPQRRLAARDVRRRQRAEHEREPEQQRGAAPPAHPAAGSSSARWAPRSDGIAIRRPRWRRAIADSDREAVAAMRAASPRGDDQRRQRRRAARGRRRRTSIADVSAGAADADVHMPAAVLDRVGHEVRARLREPQRIAGDERGRRLDHERGAAGLGERRPGRRGVGQQPPEVDGLPAPRAAPAGGRPARGSRAAARGRSPPPAPTAPGRRARAARSPAGRAPRAAPGPPPRRAAGPTARRSTSTQAITPRAPRPPARRPAGSPRPTR